MSFQLGSSKSSNLFLVILLFTLHPCSWTFFSIILFQQNVSFGLSNSVTLDVETTEKFTSSGNYSIDYNLNDVNSQIVKIPPNTSLEVKVYGVNSTAAYFLVVQAHSRGKPLTLSYNHKNNLNNSVTTTDPALVIFLHNTSDVGNPDTSYSDDDVSHFFIDNFHNRNISTLLIIRNYTHEDPVPGGLNLNYSFPLPFLTLDQNLLMTSVFFAPASSIFAETPSLTYEIYLTYMYEGDLREEHYWESVILSSSIESLRDSAKIVDRFSSASSSSSVHERPFVSYSGVGAVVTVYVSSNESHGSLYSTSVFYGCDFFPEEGYNCTKLVSPMAKLFCASLLFFGVILLFLGHRWLNFTMFAAGFFFSWFILFIAFIHLPSANFEALQVCTLLGALIGGIGWLAFWQTVHRPFYSAILIILQSALLAAMVFVHFTKYAIVPTADNIGLFITLPIIVMLLITAYAVVDIKKMHIISCSLMGSYMMIVPFAFYVGSSLTYIVINVVSIMAVPTFSKAVGYPPFQNSDIIFLCVWVMLFSLGTSYQMYRERTSPPFQPPSTAFWNSTMSIFSFMRNKLNFSRQPRLDDDSLFDDRPSLFSRIASGCPLLGVLHCKRGEEPLDGYESFPRIGSVGERLSVYGRSVAFFRRLDTRIRETWQAIRGRGSPQRRESQEALRGAALPGDDAVGADVTDHAENFVTELENDIGCCAFGKSTHAIGADYETTD